MSGSCAFPRTSRLTVKRAFDRVFRDGVRSSDPAFTVLAAHNDQPAPRLGLAVSRKTSRLATRRNRIKRIVRESFRLAAATLPAADVVVIAKPPADAASGADLRESLRRHWRRISRKCAP